MTSETSQHPFPADPAAAILLLDPVLEGVAILLEQIPPAAASRPTPCAEYDVAALRDHMLGWMQFFDAALADPLGETVRLDPTTYHAPADPAEAAGLVRRAATGLAGSIRRGGLDGEALMVQAKMPVRSMLGMALWEYQMHGWDLATANGLPWEPPAQASLTALAFAPMMLTPQYRGPDKSFGDEVPVPDDATPLERLLGFSGRDPRWAAPA